MHITAPPISEHRLTRLHRWATLWLIWFAAFLEGAAQFAPLSPAVERCAHEWLDHMAALIVRIVVIRAGRRMRRVTPRKGVSQRRRIETSFFRAAVGTRVWRRLYARDLSQRIAALRQSIKTLVDAVLRRCPCGLTRRRPFKPRPELVASRLCDGFRAPVCAADTS